MDSAVDIDVRDITICPICQNIYQDPKLLPCLHNFCRKCLETSDAGQHGTQVHGTGVQGINNQSTENAMADGRNRINLDTDERSHEIQSTHAEHTDEERTDTVGQSTVKPSTRDRYECKICQTEYVIPAGGISNLPSNAFVKQLTVLAELSRASSPKPCETCPASRNSVSRIYCMDCDQTMCEECRESHWRSRVSQNHKSLVFESQLDPDVIKHRSCYCDLHPQNQLSMYCRDHRATLCFQCAAVDHRNDNCVPLGTVTGKFESQLNEDMRKLDKRLDQCNEATGKLEAMKRSLKEEVSNTEAAIDGAVSECMAIIKRAGDVLREKLNSWKGENLDEIESKKQEVQRFVRRIDVYKRLAEELLQKGTAADFSNATDLLNTRARELDLSPIDCEGNDLNISRTAFCPTNLAGLLQASGIKSAVGDLHFIQASQRYIKFSRNATDPTPIVPPVTATVEQRSQVTRSPTVEVDGIRSLEDSDAVAILLKTASIDGERIELQNFLEIDKTLEVRFCEKIKYQLKSMTLEGQNLTFHWRNDEVKPFQAQLLVMSNFEDELMKAGLQSNVKITKDGIFLRGSEDAKVTAKIAVLDKIMKIVGTSISPSAVSEVQGKLMRRDSVQEYVHTICQQRDIKATLSIDPVLQICAFDEQENARLESTLPSIIKHLEFSLADVPDFAAASLSDELKKRPEEIEFIIDSVQKKITIACLDNEEGQIREFVEQFIRANCIIEKCVSLTEQQKDYIWKYNAEGLYVLKESLRKAGGCLTYNEGVVTLKGNSTSVDASEAQLRKIVESLVERSYTIDHPGGESILAKTALGKLILEGIESVDHVLVAVSSREQESPSANFDRADPQGFLTSTELSSAFARTILTRFTNDTGVTVSVVTGNIESQKVDAIVNSTSRHLRLDGGSISNSILSTAGPTIQEECRKIGFVELGKIVRTQGFRLPSKYVYHAAATQWDGENGKSKAVLSDLVKSCLQQAHTDGLKSLAFPAIGIGVLKIPADVVVRTLFKEIDDFSRVHPATCLKDIRFVIFNLNLADMFKSKLDSLMSLVGSRSWKIFVRQPLKPNPTKTSLTILASSEKSADDAFKRIAEILRVQIVVECIDSATDIEAIGFLTNEKIKRIEELQTHYSVRISLESTHVLQIMGTQKDVAKAGRIVRNMIHNRDSD